MIRRILGATLLVVMVAGCTGPQAGPATPQNASEELTLLQQQEALLLANKPAATTQEPEPPQHLLAIRPGDRLRLDVWLKDRVSQLSGFPVETLVPDTGEVFLPHLGAIKVAGQTTVSLTEQLNKEVNRFLQDAYVVINIHREKVSSRDQREGIELGNHVVVMGFVNRPGLYNVQPGLRVRDVLAMAGDFTRYANKTVFLVRGDRQKPEVIRVRMDDILRGRDLSQNMMLAANDAIYVSPKKLWEIADFISLFLMPIVSVRDAYWVYDRVMD